MKTLIDSKKLSMLLIIGLLMSTFAALAFVTTAMVAPVAAQAATDWPMFHHDSALLGATQSMGPDKIHVAWMYDTHNNGESSPAVVAGKVYIGSDDGALYCLDGAVGTLVWKYQTGGPIPSSPAVVGDKVYFGSSDDNVYCITTGGTLVWKYTTGDWVFSYPNVVNGLVYIASWDGKIYCLNATSGALVWSYQTGARIGKICPSVANGRVFVGGEDTYVYCNNATTGTLLWKFKTGNYIWQSSATVPGNGRVYIGSGDQYWYCLNETTKNPAGQQLWRFRVIEWDPAVESDVVESTAAYYNGFLYMNFLHKVIKFDAVTGQVLGYISTGHTARSPPALSIPSNRVYAGADDRDLYVIDAASMTTLEYYKATATFESAPAIADGKIYIGNGNGFVYCFVQTGSNVPTSINCRVFPTSVKLGQGLTIEGNLIPGRLLVTITLNLTKPDGTTMSVNLAAKEDGYFTKFLYPEVPGKWSVKARFAGLGAFQGSTSSAVNFTVTGTLPLTKTAISCWTDPKNLNLGDNAYVRGGITNPVSGATVTLTYNKPDSTTTTRTVTTAADGTYEDTFAPDLKGAWTVFASWAGDATHVGATSSWTFFTVQTPTSAVVSPVTSTGIPVEVTYGIVAMIVIAIIAIAAVWYIGRKKT